jgi:hypothetical protein
MAVSIADYRKALGKKANNLTDTEVERRFALSERLARAFFDAWKRDKKASSRTRDTGKAAVQ